MPRRLSRRLSRFPEEGREAPPGGRAQPQPLPSPQRPGKGRAVLFLDANATIRRVGKALLEKEGYRVIEASSVSGGLAASAAAAEAGSPLDLVVAEIDWPGKDGLEVLDALRIVRPGLPCVFLGASQVDPAYIEAVEREGIHFVAKPFSARQLLRAVEGQLNLAKAS